MPLVPLQKSSGQPHLLLWEVGGGMQTAIINTTSTQYKDDTTDLSNMVIKILNSRVILVYSNHFLTMSISQ